MNTYRTLALLAVSLLPLSLRAQNSDFVPLGESELVGYWQVVEIPDEKQTGKYKNAEMFNGEPCNIQIFRENGTYWSGVLLLSRWTARDCASRFYQEVAANARPRT